MTNEKIKETFITKLAAFITDYYNSSAGYYYPRFFEFIEDLLYENYLYELQEENPDVDLDEAEDNYEMDMEEFEFYVEEYLRQTYGSWEEILEDVGEVVVNKFLEENTQFEIDDDDNLVYYEPVGISKHIQLRFEHPQDFHRTIKNRKYVWRNQLSEETAYNWLMEDGIFKYFKDLKISDKKVFYDLFNNVYYDLCEEGQLYRKTVVKF